MIEVMKRNGSIVAFEVEKIIRAIEKAMRETDPGVDSVMSHQIADAISEKASTSHRPMEVEAIQDMVEDMLMESPRKDVAKKYIIYRNEQSKTREVRKADHRLLSDDFVSKYKHMNSPMNQLGDFVYYRTYSRWMPEEKRKLVGNGQKSGGI